MRRQSDGFTLVELLISMAITGIVAAAIYTTFQSQRRIYIQQDNVAVMQQNLRAAIEIMARDIRMAGYNPRKIAGTGIIDIAPRDKDYNIDSTGSGNGAIQIAADLNGDGVLGASETISFSLFDYPTTNPDGKLDLARNIGAGRQLLAENIEALGFAFAFDADNDDALDTYADTSGNQHIIWAVDSDGDNDLDINLDTNNDGVIDASDGPSGGSGVITGRALVDSNGNAIADVAVNSIRAVRVWMLVAAERPDMKYLNRNTYVVGHKVITPNSDAIVSNDNRRMRLISTIIKCRNLGLVQ